MSILIEDGPRPGRAGWICGVVGQGLASGVVVTPWETPVSNNPGSGRKTGIAAWVGGLRAAGVSVWFDPVTHALQTREVGDFRYYDEYDLWCGSRGDLAEPVLREQHVAKIFNIQDRLAVPHLGPTVLLDGGLNYQSTLALDLAHEAVERDPCCWLSIAGTAAFWSTSTPLDAHVGALATLRPGGWFLTVVHHTTAFPAPVTAEDVHGLCRTARALGQYAPVHISHGDQAGLPAIAAGATSLGIGWEQCQRRCRYRDHPGSDSNAGDGSRDMRLPEPVSREHFEQHLMVLNAVIDELKTIGDPRARYQHLASLYRAPGSWRSGVCSCGGYAHTPQEWQERIDRLAAGLALYGVTEGW